MKSYFELLCCLPLVVMNSDEQFSDNADKRMFIQLVNENVTRFHLEYTLDIYTKQNSKGQFLLPFFKFKNLFLI